MSISSSHQDLFHQPSAAEKISFVRSLMETGDLNAEVAVALVKSIHTELAQPQGQDHSSYASYARMMASLQHHMPEIHEQVVANWQAPRRLRAESEEVSGEDDFVETETAGEVKRTEPSNREEGNQDKEFWETEGEAEGSESEAEEQEERSEGEEKEEREDEEPENEEQKREDEPEEEKSEEVEDNVEENEIEQEELETKEEQGKEELSE